jgi:hypothetical protein
MTLYHAKASKQRPSKLLQSLLYPVQISYYRYKVTFALYMMTPGEQLILNLFFLSCIALLGAGVFFYLPSFVLRSAMRLAWYYGGSDPALSQFIADLLTNPLSGEASLLQLSNSVSSSNGSIAIERA